VKPAPPPARLEWLGLSLAVALAVALLALCAALTGPAAVPLADRGAPAAEAGGRPYSLSPAAVALAIRFASA
jgi:hypothetical protein